LGADAAKLLEVGAKGAAKAGGEQAAFALVRWIAGKTDGKVAADLSDDVLRDAFRARKTGGSSALRDAERAACEACFPAGTHVATPQGGQAIESLHAGDLVQAENPATGKVEAEAVQAVIQDPVSPLVAVDLSDGSAITVTADHPFWVDADAQLAGAGWFAAGSLQAGDELRTVAGVHVMVVGLRRNVGHAVVYTLTVAKDHTFFVGAARVLVHNAVGCSSRTLGRNIAKYFVRRADTAAHHIVWCLDYPDSRGAGRWFKTTEPPPVGALKKGEFRLNQPPWGASGGSLDAYGRVSDSRKGELIAGRGAWGNDPDAAINVTMAHLVGVK